MKVRNFTLFLLTYFLLFNSNPIFSQVELDFPQAPDDITVCEAPGQSYFSLAVTTDYEIDSLTISMPLGIHYVPESIQFTSGTGLTLAELDISNLSRPTFVLNRTELESGDYIEFTISKTGDCDAILYSQGSNLAHDTLGVWRDTMVAEGVTTNYNITFGSIYTSYVHSSDTIVMDLPSLVCREIQIVNGGTGYLSKIQHRVNPGSDLENYQLRYQGTPLVPSNEVGGELIYDFDLSMPPF